MRHVLCEGLDFPSCILIHEFPLGFFSWYSVIWCFLFSLHPPCLPPSFPELAEESWLRNPKKAGGAEEAQKERACRSHPFLASLCFFYSSVHLFIHHHCITPVLFPTHGLPWFSSVLSWHVTSECMMCWFIAKLRRHTPAVAEINPSDPVVMRLQVGCFCCVYFLVSWVRVCVCVWVRERERELSRHTNNASTTENGVVCTLLTMLCGPRGLIVCHAHGFIKSEKGNENEGNKG